MSDTPPPEGNTPDSPFKLNTGRVVLLVLGLLLVLYTLSALLGGLGNYEKLKEGALDARQQNATEQPDVTD